MLRYGTGSDRIAQSGTRSIAPASADEAQSGPLHSIHRHPEPASAGLSAEEWFSLHRFRREFRRSNRHSGPLGAVRADTLGCSVVPYFGMVRRSPPWHHRGGLLLLAVLARSLLGLAAGPLGASGMARGLGGGGSCSGVLGRAQWVERPPAPLPPPSLTT